MEPNQHLVNIKESILIRDMTKLRVAIDGLTSHLLMNKPEPIWGWNGFLSKTDFKTLSSKCPKCDLYPIFVNRGLFGFECKCAACEVTGNGNEVLDAVKDFLTK